ncbi:hypothetical protein CPB83DRAFT_859161 [Crepidotus variabilis]|uniref:XLF-like N-terminal domain-containing protein n=1 Tax=Crepidotus variabilis TaxID=179855 RepID=A0A9P6EAV5_9AGAR|nr:hypothetical protein CPB83DRAFT_859161 [Crepidotus variabilis]
MEFTEEHAKRLLSKEWLAKSDPATSTPYLMKYDCSVAEQTCCWLVTDTKTVWAEAIGSSQIARRWRSLNLLAPLPFTKPAQEDAWRDYILDLLSKAHTIGGVADLTFELVETRYSDLGFESECEAFKWRWEANALGQKWSSEIISRHLVLPLISLTHLSFASADAMSAVPDVEVEKAVDKLGRTARRTIDTHIKNAISKPRVSTSIRRMTAMFNFVQDLPPVTSTAETPLLQVEQFETEKLTLPPNETKEPEHDNPPTLSSAPARGNNNRERNLPLEPQAQSSSKPAHQSDSATESEGDVEAMDTSRNNKREMQTNISAAAALKETPEHSQLRQTRTSQSPAPLGIPSTSKPPPPAASDSDSSPHRPLKKAKARARASSDEDSEEERKKRVAHLKGSGSNATGGVKRGGTRQPIKRGGKRF